MTDLDKMIIELENEVKYFIELQKQGEDTLRWKIEEIKRNYALELLSQLKELGYE